MSRELAGKVAIVTGGANGIGRGTVELFVEHGAHVVIADIDEQRGAELASRLGRGTRFKRTDVSKRDEVQSLVDFAVSEFGGLHVMFNNAGLSDTSYGRLLDEDFSKFERVMQVNLLGVMLGTQIAARHMSGNGGGSIINTASLAGLRAGFGFSMYRAAKAGIVHFSKSAAIELGEYLVRVNCICPANVQTEMGTFAAPEPGMTEEQAARMHGAIERIRMSRQPLKRRGYASDIANAAMFLGSDRSVYVTGQILAIDGGASAGDALSQIGEIMEARVAAKQG